MWRITKQAQSHVFLTNALQGGGIRGYRSSHQLCRVVTEVDGVNSTSEIELIAASHVNTATCRGLEQTRLITHTFAAFVIFELDLSCQVEKEIQNARIVTDGVGAIL